MVGAVDDRKSFLAIRNARAWKRDCCAVVAHARRFSAAPETSWEPGRGKVNQAAGVQVVERGFQNIVRLEGVQKFFGPVQALRDIDLAIGKNEIVGLIGDNGAGKSTLIKIMTGVLPPSSGRIFVRDRELSLADYSVRMAHELSIETVYQDRSLADKQPLWRNFFVGRQITNRFGFINVKREKEIAQRILIDVIGFRGVGITVDSTVANLSGGERQGIAIGRAMHYNADLIVLDEPTAALGVAEVRKVVEFVRRIKQSGRACIYIEHNLAHVHEVADRLVVLDRGRVVSEISPKDMTVPELTEYLIALQHQT
jgi:simple sugar transport system ATP-binding protein